MLAPSARIKKRLGRSPASEMQRSASKATQLSGLRVARQRPSRAGGIEVGAGADAVPVEAFGGVDARDVGELLARVSDSCEPDPRAAAPSCVEELLDENGAASRAASPACSPTTIATPTAKRERIGFALDEIMRGK